MNGLTVKEKQTACEYALNGADFMFISSPELCTMLIKGSSQTKGINNVMTAILLERKPVRLDSAMIIKYCSGTLDRSNTWLFDNGNIKVVPHQLKKKIKLKPKEDDDIKNKPKIEKKDGKLFLEKKEENNNEK